MLVVWWYNKEITF